MMEIMYDGISLLDSGLFPPHPSRDLAFWRFQIRGKPGLPDFRDIDGDVCRDTFA